MQRKDYSVCRDAMNASASAMALSISRTSLSTFVWTLVSSPLSPAIALALRLCFMKSTWSRNGDRAGLDKRSSKQVVLRNVRYARCVIWEILSNMGAS